MHPIDEVFARLRSRGETAFIPFVPAGDPDLAGTALLVRGLAAVGASLIEIGFPFSDPIADGPTIQAAYTRALAKGLRVEQLFETIHRLTHGPDAVAVPLVGMVSVSLIHRRQPDRFVREASAAGLAGLIVPDLPADESQPLLELAGEAGLHLIQLVTPTTSAARAEQIAACARGFVYCVSVAGITGTRGELPPELPQRLAQLRAITALPLCVGFGVSTPQQIRQLRSHCDGVIVGSALVRFLEMARPFAEQSRDLLAHARDLAHECRVG